ncbi:MAG: hypothetical protein AAF602_06440, partial [Myxococcota bacterium]
MMDRIGEEAVQEAALGVVRITWLVGLRVVDDMGDDIDLFSHPAWRFLTRNLVLKAIPEEIYIVSHI